MNVATTTTPMRRVVRDLDEDIGVYLKLMSGFVYHEPPLIENVGFELSKTFYEPFCEYARSQEYKGKTLRQDEFAYLFTKFCPMSKDVNPFEIFMKQPYICLSPHKFMTDREFSVLFRKFKSEYGLHDRLSHEDILTGLTKYGVNISRCTKIVRGKDVHDDYLLGINIEQDTSKL